MATYFLDRTNSNGAHVKYGTQRGALLVELAIALPLALALLFFVYWFFLATTWRTHLKAAVFLAVDLAQSRGNPIVMGRCDASGNCASQSTLEALDIYHKEGTWDLQLGTISAGVVSTGLLVGGLHEQAAVAEIVYNNYINQKLGPYSKYQNNLPVPISNVSLRTFPVQTLYAMAYAYEIIRSRIGGSLRFPCDPVEPGCLICSPASGDFYQTVSTTRFAIQCSMQPTDILLSPIFVLLGGLGAEPNIMTFSSMERTG